LGAVKPGFVKEGHLNLIGRTPVHLHLSWPPGILPEGVPPGYREWWEGEVGRDKGTGDETPFFLCHSHVADFPLISGRPLIHAVSQGTGIPGMVSPPLAAIKKLPPL